MTRKRAKRCRIVSGPTPAGRGRAVRRSARCALRPARPIRRCRLEARALHLREGRGAEQAGRPDEQDDDQDAEDDQVLVRGGDVGSGERLGEPDQEAAEHGAGNRADAADDRGGEPFQAGDEAHEVEDAAEDEPGHDAAPASADPIRNVAHDHPVDVDPLIAAASRSYDGGPHRLAQLRAADEQRQRDHERER